jgi:hypothetical protein
MARPEKLATLEPDGRWVRYRHPNRWQLEHTRGLDRLVLAPASQHVELLVDLLRELPEPFGLLYVLLVSRTGQGGARRQSPTAMSFAQI